MNKRFVQPETLLPLAGEAQEPRSSSGFYRRISIAPDVAMESQTLWSSIGWGTPATSSQVMVGTSSAQEIGVMGFTGISPVVMLTTTFLSGVMQTSKKHWAVGVGGAARLPHWQGLIRHSPQSTTIQVLSTSRS